MSRLLVGAALTLLLVGPALGQGDKKKTPPTDKEIAELISKLGDAQFQERQKAYKTLVEIGKPALPRLQKAAQSEEVEVQMRARKAIKEIEAQPAPLPNRSGQATKENFQKESAPLDEKLEMPHVTIHQLTTEGLVKEVREGVVVVQEASRNKEMMAKVYVQALPEAKKGSLFTKTGGICCILAAGPVLDNSWQVAARSLVRRGQELELTIVLAKSDGEKTTPVRHLVYNPMQLPEGTYKLTTTWRFLESLPDGKPTKTKPLSYSCEFTRGERPVTKEGQEGGSTEPKGLKLTARLIAKETAYPLDLDGKTPEQFRKMIEEAKSKGGPLPPAPTVNLVLELRYTGAFGSELDVCLGKGDTGPVHGLTLDLKGPGAASASFANARGARVSPTIVKLVAGKTHSIPLGKLEVFDGRTTQAWYWTQPGEYTVVVSCGVVEGGEKGMWRAAGKVVSAPIKLKVGAK
jgi:hypothetical protein